MLLVKFWNSYKIFSLLISECANGNIDIVKYLIERNGFNVDGKDIQLFYLEFI